MKDKNIYLKWDADNECYTLALNGNLQFDVEGSYEVAVALDNGRTATVKWDVKKFGTPVELKLSYKQEAVELNGVAVIDELVYVDADGVKRNAEWCSFNGIRSTCAIFYNITINVGQLELNIICIVSNLLMLLLLAVSVMLQLMV